MSGKSQKPAPMGFKIGFATEGYVMPALAPMPDEPREEHGARANRGIYVTKRGGASVVAENTRIRPQKIRQWKVGKADKIISAMVKQHRRQAEELVALDRSSSLMP